MIDQNKIYEFIGSHYDMGYQQGEVFKSVAGEAFNRFKNLEEVKGLKPKWLPANTFIKIASKRAINWLKPIIKKHAPNQAERIEGMANGSGLDEKLMYLFSGAELLLGELDWELPHLKTGCTSIAYRSNKLDKDLWIQVTNACRAFKSAKKTKFKDI